jgi:hypothetical protein
MRAGLLAGSPPLLPTLLTERPLAAVLQVGSVDCIEWLLSGAKSDIVIVGTFTRKKVGGRPVGGNTKPDGSKEPEALLHLMETLIALP